MGVPSAETPGLREAILKNALLTEEHHRGIATSLRRSLNYLEEHPEAIHYEVVIRSLWEEDRVQVLTAKGKSLRTVISRAIARFKKANRRKDVQAKYEAYAAIGAPHQEHLVRIPEEFFLTYCT